MIELFPAYLELRPKGRRLRVQVDYRSILDLGYKILYRKTLEEKKAAKKKRRKGKRER